MKVFKLHFFKESPTGLHQILSARIGTNKEEISFTVALHFLVVGLIVPQKSEVYRLPHIGPTGEGAEELVVAASGEILHPMLLRKAFEIPLVGEKKEGVEVNVFHCGGSITTDVHPHLTLAMLMHRDQVRIRVMSVEERIHRQ